jgi:hypothetical protein
MRHQRGRRGVGMQKLHGKHRRETIFVVHTPAIFVRVSIPTAAPARPEMVTCISFIICELSLIRELRQIGHLLGVDGVVGFLSLHYGVCLFPNNSFPGKPLDDAVATILLLLILRRMRLDSV